MTDAVIDFLCITYLDSIIPNDEMLRVNSRLITVEEWRELDEFADSLRKYTEQYAGAELSGALAK